MYGIATIETDPQSPFGPPEVPPAEWTYRHVTEKAYRRGPQYALAWLHQAGVDALPSFPTHASCERAVGAYVNHGRWLWDCPHCGAAQVATPHDPRAFCVACFNHGDGWWPVRFPDAAVTIELLLGRRPRAEQRNWTPGETIEQLQAENLSVGVDPSAVGYPWAGADRGLELVTAHLAARGLGPGRMPLALEAG